MYKIEYVVATKKDLSSISKSNKEQIRKAIEKKLATNPIEFGKPLQYSLRGLRRLRVGDYRIIFQIEEKKKVVLVVKIGHRKEVYE
ncbi:MAG: type II toxin-antitoxin system RelE/ParE family toxin [Pseudomonadota bacterium]|nr:type II toxin-antitoxin system RelE/ParE family toxin [Pseudomonadota bacterium]